MGTRGWTLSILGSGIVTLFVNSQTSTKTDAIGNQAEFNFRRRRRKMERWAQTIYFTAFSRLHTTFRYLACPRNQKFYLNFSILCLSNIYKILYIFTRTIRLKITTTTTRSKISKGFSIYFKTLEVCYCNNCSSTFFNRYV